MLLSLYKIYLTMEWNNGPYFKLTLKNLIFYFSFLSVSFHEIFSLFGFFTFLTISLQLVSGMMLSFSLVPESMMISMVSEEEDTDDLYMDDFFWLHESGVDMIFMFSYIHLFSKLYLNMYEYENESAWKSGVFVFLLFQVVVFLGLVLCSTHLSEMTLTMAANILHTFFLFKGKFYWWLFTDKQLNTDTIISLAYLHYVSAFFLFYMALIHGIDMHYDWKNENSFDGIDSEMIWFDEALSNEMMNFMKMLVILTMIFYFLYTEPEALSYEIFMWGDIGLVTDVSYYGVAPHWYFSPFMAWLMACPHHKTGIFGLLFFFFILFFQPNVNGMKFYKNNLNSNIFFNKFKVLNFYMNNEKNLFFMFFYFIFIFCCLYAASFLPYGSFYNSLGGNIGMLLAYMFIFIYLGTSFFKKNVFLYFYILNLKTMFNR